MRSFFRILFPCLSVLSLVGCGLTLGEEPSLQNRCSSDADCAGATCEPGTGMCVTESIQPLQVGLAVTPASSGTSNVVPAAEFGAVRVTGPSTQDITMPRSILAAGRVEWAKTGETVPAQVKFIRPSLLPGNGPIELSTSTSPQTVAVTTGVQADYQLRVTAGALYDVVVEPSGDAARAFPPLYLSDQMAPKQGDVWPLDIVYPAQLASVPATGSGLVVSIEGGQQVPQDGLQVRAVEVGTGRIVSSTALTGTTSTLPLTTSDPGSFVLHLSPSAGSFVLRVTAGADRPLFPTLTIDPSQLFPGAVLVPSLQPVTYEGQVEAMSSAGTVRVPNAIITLVSDDVFANLSQETASFRTTATTDADGQFSVQLLPGNYDVIISPPASMGTGDPSMVAVASRDFGVLVQQNVHIDATNSVIRGQLFTVPLRAHLGGDVETADERPVSGATAQATALGRSVVGGDPAAPYNRSSDTLTDAHGLFDLRLDVGVYDLAVKPPMGSGFPWVVEPGWWTSEPGAVVNEHFEIGSPVPLRGVVRDADGAALPGAEVKAYAVVEDPPGELRSVAVARSVTDSDGSYELLLPPRL